MGRVYPLEWVMETTFPSPLSWHSTAKSRRMAAVNNATSAKWAPWYIIPADHKSVARALVSRIIATTIEPLDLRYPEVTEAQKDVIAEARRQLEAEGKV
jgi:hypothetical protein